SLGVTLCDGPDDLPGALQRLGELDETLRSAHARPDAFMIEERLRGDEVSVEALVADGEVCFINVTDKELFAGPRPVEAGHTVPSCQPPAVREELASAMQRLVCATAAGTTVLHAEWIVDSSGTPWLVECAARVPGDNICSLISLAHEHSFVEAYLELLRGKVPAAMSPQRAAAIRFIDAQPGVVTDVVGVDAARSLPGVIEAEVSAAAGQTTGAIGSSYSRLGHVMVTGPDRAGTVATAEQARALIKVVTQPLAAAT
ncbi:MAG TPA: ATP-grasp domain-containing protein, partial [Streptosporangiaceae bacterium]|nr:ATP-grasp domain-containing protein [Streptosporangiaceae bacterium]